jgi:hypothetical protein
MTGWMNSWPSKRRRSQCLTLYDYSRKPRASWVGMGVVLDGTCHTETGGQVTPRSVRLYAKLPESIDSTIFGSLASAAPPPKLGSVIPTRLAPTPA